MQTYKDCLDMTAGLVGDPEFDWLTANYFNQKLAIAYNWAIQYLAANSCTPYIEDVVIVPGVQVGVDESNLVPSAISGSNTPPNPLKWLKTPRFLDFKPPGTPATQFRPAKQFSIPPDSVQQVTAQAYDFRIRGDFIPKLPTEDEQTFGLHPLIATPLAAKVAALIGAEKPNQKWVDNYNPEAISFMDNIVADLVKERQRLVFRTGNPNRQIDAGWNWNLQGNVGWEWRSNTLYVRLI